MESLFGSKQKPHRRNKNELTHTFNQIQLLAGVSGQTGNACLALYLTKVLLTFREPYL